MLRQWLRLLDPRIHELKQDAGQSPATRLQFARALNGRCMHEEARAVLEGGLIESKEDQDLWFERIMALGDHASAEEMEDLSARLSGLQGERPQDPAVLRNLGFLRILQQRLDARPERHAGTGDRGVMVGPDDVPACSLGLFAAQAELIRDRGGVLAIGGVAGI